MSSTNTRRPDNTEEFPARTPSINKASACADLFQIPKVILAAAPGEVADEMDGGKLIGGMIRKKNSEVLPFDVEKAEVLCGELRVAIDDFIEAVDTELGQ